MNCEEVKNSLIFGIYGQFTKQQQRGLKIHLRECLRCKQLLRQLEKYKGLITGKEDLPITIWAKS